MVNYSEILKNYNFEIFTLAGEQMSCAIGNDSKYRAYAQANTRPGGFGVFQFDDLSPVGEITNEKGAWSCFIKNVQTNRYLNTDFVVFTNFSANEKRLFTISFTKEINKAAEWTISLKDTNLSLVKSADSVGGIGLSNLSSTKWSFNLRQLHLDYLLHGITYLPTDETENVTKPHNFVTKGLVQTSQNTTASDETGLTFVKTNTFEWGFEQTLAVGATAKAKVSSPGGFVEVEAELRLDASFSSSRKNIVTNEIEYRFDTVAEIGPNTKAFITAWVDWNENAKYPFEAIFSISGTALGRDGDSEADTLTSREIQLVLLEKGYAGTPMESNSPIAFKTKITGVLTGSFGVNKGFLIEEEE